MTINVTKTYLPNMQKYIGYLEHIYESGWLTNNGHCVQLLTKRLEAYLGVRNLILVSNATLGLQLAYKALNLTGEVVTTPFSFVATTSSLVWEGVKPKFVDIHQGTFCLDEAKIEGALSLKTSAILPVHVYGNVCEVEEIQAIADKHYLKVIYDAAHAFGVNYKEQSVLNYGDISILSFHATKLFHTVEGGALIIKDDAIYTKVKEMINFGFDTRGSGEILSLGINAKMSEFHAAMGLCVLDDMEYILQERKRVDQYYRQHLSSNIQLLEINQSATANYAYFPVVFNSEAQLLSVVSALNAGGVTPRRYFYPSLNTLSYVEQVHMPVSEDIAKKVLCLPIYPELVDNDLIFICNIINTTLR